MARKFLTGIISKFITGLDDPILPTDAVNKKWVDPKLVPSGGLYKQRLIKSSDIDYEYEWADEDDRMKKIVDEIDSTLMYIGSAQPGTTNNSSTWSIQKIEFLGDDIFITWANSVNTFTNIWDDRLTYTYG